jgi:rRNA-processing protein FCF1
MEVVVVNDTNIFLDLYSIGCLDYFFQLPFTVHTVDFVLNEIKDEAQRSSLQPYLKCGLLHVHRFSAEELVDVVELHEEASGNVSIVDCSVWYYAQRNDYILLTGDRQLRARAINSHVTVRGIIYVFDCLVENRLMPPSLAADKMEELMAINQRLPKKIIQERIEVWRSR